MKSFDRIMSNGGFVRGELIMWVAESDVGKTKLPQRLERKSDRLGNIQLVALGGCLMGGLHVIIFFTKAAELLWNLLPDKCQMEHCRKLGIRGNENNDNGVIMCDYCSFQKAHGEHRANRK